MLNGILDLSWWQYIVVTLILTHITIAAVTLFLHRNQTHRAINLHPIISHFFRFWLWLTTSIVTKEWVAIHRKHHAKCETPEDPHSPIIYGIKKVLFQGAELYRAEAENSETLKNYGHNTSNDWLERNIYSKRRYNKIGIALMFMIDVILFGPIGITIWAIQMAWIPFNAAGLINGAGHYFGYRNFEVSNAATNFMPLGILIGGEEHHNNHHAFASSAKFSVKWFEFDIGWMYITILSILGLCKINKIAPKPVIDTNKPSIDIDTVMALVTNRFQLMSNYAHQVMKQVCDDEVKKTENGVLRKQIKRVRKLMTRDDTLIDEPSRRKLEATLSNNQTLDTVYEFKQSLHNIWHKTAESHEQRLQAILEWCHQAETTGIKALQDFANSLKGYSMAHSVA